MNSGPSAPFSVRTLLSLAFWGTILVVLAGSIVRTTGSGLGCPDWPHCFGSWIPPSTVTELPIDYKIRFQVAGREIADFNAFKTWVEYLNRLLGVLLGMVLVLLSMVTIAKRRTTTRKIFWGAQMALVLVILQGALGAVVVSSHLHGQFITLHLVLAIALAILLKRLQILAGERNYFIYKTPSIIWRRSARLVYVIAIAQLVLGTEVRKSIDHLVHEFVALPRWQWAEHLNWTFLVHRSLALVFVGASVAWFWRSLRENMRIRGPFAVLAACVFVAVFSGVVMRELGFPQWAQPLHLVLATLLIVQVDRIYRLSI